MGFQIPVNKKNKSESYQEDLEERIISLIASLFGKKVYSNISCIVALDCI
jgi:beta-catenin-like protein 1